MNTSPSNSPTPDVAGDSQPANQKPHGHGAVSAAAAWEIFLGGAPDSAFVAEHFDVLSESINEPFLDGMESPLQVLARIATGQQMRLATALFESAVAKKTLAAFPEGSIGAMAIAAGNSEGALEAAKASPDLHQMMRSSSNVTMLVQCLISEDFDLLKRLTARINDKPLLDPYYTDKAGISSLSAYFRKAPIPSVVAVRAFADCLLQSRNLDDVSSAYYQRHLGLLDRYGKSCLHVLAQRMSDTRVPDATFAELFTWLSSQMDINHPDSEDETVLISASHHDRPMINRTLLEEGALLEWVSHKGRTALSVAAYHGHSELISLYMDFNPSLANTDPAFKKADADKERLRVPLIAARNKHWNTLKQYLSYSKEGINQHEPSEDRHTPLILAVKDLDSSAVSALIKAGVDINATNSHGWTAVHYAAHHFSGKDLKNRNDPSTRILFDLITHGGQLETPDKKGITPLEVIFQRADIGSDDLFFAVNVSLLSEWAFAGSRTLAEQYVDEVNALSFLTHAPLTHVHPLVSKAEKWKVANQGKIKVAKDKKLKQAKTDLVSILVDCFNYSVATFGLISLEPFPPVKKFYDSIPPEWQWPAVGAVGVVMGLARATEFRGNMEKFQNIGYAAATFGKKIHSKILSPVLKLLKNCTSGDEGPLRHVYGYFSSMRKTCLKIAMASKAFVHVMRREKLSEAAPTDLANQLDPEMMRAIGNMSHQDFQKFRAQAKINARKPQQEGGGSPAP